MATDDRMAGGDAVKRCRFDARTAKITKFDRKDKLNLIDRTSGAWDHDTNQRACHCGRCGLAIPMGEGTPYNEFMSDHYRASTRYLCALCKDEPSAFDRAHSAATDTSSNRALQAGRTAT